MTDTNANSVQIL